LLKRIGFIEDASNEIINILDKLSSIKKPVFTEYLNNLNMVDISEKNLNRKYDSTNNNEEETIN